MIPILLNHDPDKKIGFIHVNEKNLLEIVIDKKFDVPVELVPQILANAGFRILEQRRVEDDTKGHAVSMVLRAEFLEVSMKPSDAFVTTDVAEWSDSYRCRFCKEEFALAAEDTRLPQEVHRDCPAFKK